MAGKALMLLALLDYVAGKPFKSPLPKSSQASYLPESHAIYDHHLAIAGFWTSSVGFAVRCLPCLWGMVAKALVLLALLDYVPGKLLKSPLPKSSQASYLPESHAIYDHDLAFARF